MTENLALIMMTYFIIKHFIFDFTRLQTPWMYLNKGTYGHPGGIAHAATQGIATFPILVWAALVSPPATGPAVFLTSFWLTLGVLWGEFLIHYHMDWFKAWWCKGRGYSEYVTETTVGDWIPDSGGICSSYKPHLAIYDNKYFLMLGIDQTVHYLTYVGMTWAYIM